MLDVTEYYTEEGSPCKCYKCGSKNIKSEIRDMIDVYCGQGPVCEFECVCGDCGTSVGYWAYGSYDPSYIEYITNGEVVCRLHIDLPMGS